MSFAIIFSGQGLQKTGHRQEIINLANVYGFCAELACHLPEVFDYSDDDLNHALYDNIFAQPFIFALQYGRWQWLKDHMTQMPDMFLGYSLGEVTAFCCSSNVSFSDGILMVAKRAEYMQQAGSIASSLASVQGIHLQQLTSLLDQHNCELSIELSPSNFIIGGSNQALATLAGHLSQYAGSHYKPIHVNVASHTSMMTKAAGEFGNYLSRYHNAGLTIPILSASDAQLTHTANAAVIKLSYQIDHYLRWYHTLQMLNEYRIDKVVEIGPGNALSKMVREQTSDIKIQSIDDFAQLDGVVNWLNS